jgi:hypothetical protein
MNETGITSGDTIPPVLDTWVEKVRYNPNPRTVRKTRDAVWLLLAGRSIREVAEKSGASRDKIAKLRDQLIITLSNIGLDETPLTVCECSQEAGHKGWCSVRLAKSPKRQATMKKLHAKQVR